MKYLFVAAILSLSIGALAASFSIEQADPITKAAYLGNYLELDELLKRDIDPNAQDKQGFTALSAVLMRDPFMMETEFTLRVLLDHKADPNTLDKNGDSPLMIAARRPNSYVFTYLFREGANANLKGAKGRTALMEAAAAGNFLGCEKLKAKNIAAIVKGGADKKLTDDEGFTAFDLNEKSACPSKDAAKLLKI